MLTKEAASKKQNPYVVIWEREGPQGNKWNVMEKSLFGAMIKVCWAGMCVFFVAIFTFGSLVANVRVLNFCYFSFGSCASLYKEDDVRFHTSSVTFMDPAYLTFRPVLDYRSLSVLWYAVYVEQVCLISNSLSLCLLLQIYIEGIKNPTLTGFVAIDNIRLSQGKACLGMY